MKLTSVGREGVGRGCAAEQGCGESRELRISPWDAFGELRDPAERAAQVGANKPKLRSEPVEQRPRGFGGNAQVPLVDRSLDAQPRDHHPMQEKAQQAGADLPSGEAELGEQRHGPAGPWTEKAEDANDLEAAGKDDVTLVVPVGAQAMLILAEGATAALLVDDDAGVKRIGIDPAWDSAYPLHRNLVSAGPSRQPALAATTAGAFFVPATAGLVQGLLSPSPRSSVARRRPFAPDQCGPLQLYG